MQIKKFLTISQKDSNETAAGQFWKLQNKLPIQQSC